jgi:hypothetical protein
MTFANDLFDWSYNPGNIAGSHDSATSGFLSRWAFSNNTWVLGTALNELYQLVTGGGAGNVFSGEDWTKPTGSIGGGAGMPFTNSAYTSCHFHLRDPVIFPTSATGTGCVFDSGHSGGTFK